MMIMYSFLFILNNFHLALLDLCQSEFALAPVVAAGIIAGAGSLLGSLFGGASSSKSTKETNRTNLAIANAYNQTQWDIARLNNQWNYNMQQQQNEYNSPKNQMQRFKDAGVNPYMAIGNMTAGNQESQLTASTPNMQMPSAMENEGKPLADAIMSAGQTMAQTALGVMQAIDTGQNAQFNIDTMAARTQEWMEKAKQAGYNSDMLKVQRDIVQNTQSQEIELKQLSVDSLKQQIALDTASTWKIQAEALRTELEQDLTRAEFVKLSKYINEVMPLEISNLRKQGKVLDQNVLDSICNRALQRSQIGLNNASADKVRQMLPYEIASLDLNNQLANNAVDIGNLTFDSDVEGKLGENAQKGLLKSQNSSSVGNSSIFSASSSSTGYRENDVKQHYRSNRKRMVMKHGKYVSQ